MIVCLIVCLFEGCFPSSCLSVLQTSSWCVFMSPSVSSFVWSMIGSSIACVFVVQKKKRDALESAPTVRNIDDDDEEETHTRTTTITTHTHTHTNERTTTHTPHTHHTHTHTGTHTGPLSFSLTHTQRERDAHGTHTNTHHTYTQPILYNLCKLDDLVA